jgi:hypothetical protein
MGVDPSWLYPGTIVVLLILAYMQWQINAKKTMAVILVILGYIIYSHETGHSLTEVKDNAVGSFDEAVGNSKYEKRFVSPQMRPAEAEKMVNESNGSKQ